MLTCDLTIASEAIIIEEKSFRTVAVEVTNGVDTNLITASVVYTTLIEVCRSISTILTFYQGMLTLLLTHACCISWVWHKTCVTCYWVRILGKKCRSVHKSMGIKSKVIIVSVIVIKEHRYKICFYV